MNDVFLDDIVRSGRPDPDRRSRRGEGRRDRDQRRRQRRVRSMIALVLSLAILGGAAYVVYAYVWPLLTDFTEQEEVATDYPGPGTGAVEVSIPAGATGAQMAAILLEADVVATSQSFTQAFAANPDAPGIQPGTYRLALQMRAADAVTALLNADNRVQTRVTLPEGFTVAQVVERLSSVTAVPAADIQAAMGDTAATGLPAEAAGNYEGWLFPATYTFEPDTTPAQMIQTMVAKTVEILDARQVPADQRQVVLTKASLVEREGVNAEDRAKMARAIENRLARPMPLQIDASLAYGLNKSGLDLTNADKDVENPYNLELNTGLPPTPIANPGEVSIDAVLAPADGPWIFWVTINLETGETRFAETYAEHQENVALLREWEAAQEGEA